MARIELFFASAMLLIILNLKVFVFLKIYEQCICLCIFNRINIILESFKTTIATFGHIDIVINNAGIMHDRFWELEVDINLVSGIILAPYNCNYLY
jgi:hypothetical protein